MQKLGSLFARISSRFLPEPMALACGLTVLVFGFALVFPKTPDLASKGIISRGADIADIWLAAVWNRGFLTFALQMCVVLVTGFALAQAPAIRRVLGRLADLPASSRSAAALVAVVSCVGCWINWGFGLILAGLLAVQVARSLDQRRIAHSRALLVAAAYAGMMIWHGGLSGSAPLKVAAEGIAIAGTGDTAATVALPAITVSHTIFSPTNLLLTLVLMVWVGVFFFSLGGGGRDSGSIEDPESANDTQSDDTDRCIPNNECLSPADHFNRSRFLAYSIVGLISVGLGRSVQASGWGAVGLNFVNSAFLALGLLFHGSLASYVSAVADSGRAIVGIVVQFPLYSGIQGVMFGAGLAAAVSQWFVDASVEVAELLNVSAGSTFPVATFASAAVVNFFVPSGGGQWIVQGPIMCAAADALKLPIDQTVMAIAYGDQLTNMVQPFWAIPLMGLTRVHAGKFMGYCALLMLLSAPLFVAALLLM